MMKPYADIDFYLTEYGSDNIPSSLFDKYILKASYKIKELTLGKSDLFVESKEVKNATCAIADIMYQEEDNNEELVLNIANTYLLTTGLMYRGIEWQ